MSLTKRESEKIKWSFHVFSNCVDEFTHDLAFALKQYNKWKKEMGTARLELLVDSTENGDDQPLVQENLLSFGEYPV